SCSIVFTPTVPLLMTLYVSFLLFFFFKQKTAYEIGLGIPAEPLFRSLTSKEAKLAPSVCRMTFPILASLLVRLVVLLPFQLLRLSLATPSRWKIGRASCRERV